MIIVQPAYLTKFRNTGYSQHIDELNILNIQKLYNTNRDVFFDVLLEAKMRGIRFENTNQRFFLSTTNPRNLILVVNPLENKFEKIDFESLGLGSFVERFNIQSDAFFDRFPIEGFRELNRNIQNSSLFEQFLKAGFEIITKNDLKNLNHTDFDKEQSNAIQVIPRKACTFKESINIPISKISFPIITKYLTIDDEKVSLSLSNLNQNNVGEFYYYLSMSDLSILEFKNLRDALFENTPSNLKKSILSSQISLGDIEDIFYENHDREVRNLIEKLKSREFISNVEEYNVAFNMFDIDVNLSLNANKYLSHKNMFNVFISRFKKSIQDVLDNARMYDVLSKRYLDNKTLQEISNPLKLTRERVRQILDKSLSKIDSVYLSNISNTELAYLFGRDRILDNAFLQTYFTSLESKIMYELLSRRSSEKGISILKDIYAIIFRDDFDINKIINDYFDKDIYVLSEVQEIIEMISKKEKVFLNEEYIFTYITQIFNEKNKVISRKGSTLLHTYDYLITKYLGGVYDQDSDFETLHELYKEHFENRNLSIRSIYSRMQDMDNYILINSGVFSKISNYSADVLSTQRDFIVKLVNKHLQNHREFDFYLDYKSNERMYHKNQIESGLHAYSLLKYFKEESYNFSGGNTTVVSSLGKQILTNAEELKKLLKNNNYVLEKEIIQQSLNWNPVKLNQVISLNNDLVSWDTGIVRYITANTIENNRKELNKISKYVKQILSATSFLSSSDLYTHCLFEGLNSLLDNLNISNNDQLLAIFRIAYPNDFEYGRKQIFAIGSEADSYEAVQLSLPKTFSEIEFHNIMRDKFGYAPTTASQYLKNQYRNRILYQIDRDLYMREDIYQTSLEMQNKILSYIELINKDYVVLENLELSNLPKYDSDLDIPLNIFLIGSILEENGYFKVDTKKPYDIIPLLIYTKSTDELTLEMIIHNEIKNRDIYHKNDLVDYVRKMFENPFLNVDNILNTFTNIIIVDDIRGSIEMERV